MGTAVDRVKGKRYGMWAKGMEKGGISLAKKTKEQEESANKKGTRGNVAGYWVG